MTDNSRKPKSLFARSMGNAVLCLAAAFVLYVVHQLPGLDQWVLDTFKVGAWVFTIAMIAFLLLALFGLIKTKFTKSGGNSNG